MILITRPVNHYSDKQWNLMWLVNISTTNKWFSLFLVFGFSRIPEKCFPRFFGCFASIKLKINIRNINNNKKISNHMLVFGPLIIIFHVLLGSLVSCHYMSFIETRGVTFWGESGGTWHHLLPRVFVCVVYKFVCGCACMRVCILL